VGVYRVAKQLWFCAAHQVRLSEDRCEDLHGHNYRLMVHAEAARFDHGNINEIEPFQEGGRNATAEELARFFHEELSRELDDDRVRICRVEVFETDNNRAEYVP
jgi:6-pyruvoyltetrahydropterin/6-carboxytetrahydropterin synthase